MGALHVSPPDSRRCLLLRSCAGHFYRRVPTYEGVHGEGAMRVCVCVKERASARAFERASVTHSKLPWREAGPPNHHVDKVDSDQ